jgi:hypothetical protein
MGQQPVDTVEPGKAFDISISERLETTSGPIVEPACEQHIALAFRNVKHHSNEASEKELSKALWERHAFRTF